MEKKELSAIEKCFEPLTAPRMPGKIRHRLTDIITIAICAVIAGADTCTAIEEYGKAEYDRLKGFSELPHGIPSHDTSGNIFSALSLREFEECFLSRIRSVFRSADGLRIAIDGKRLCSSYDCSSGKAAIRMVSAWADENRLIPGQVKTDENSNEIRAIPELLNVLEINGSVITIDAMGTQKEIVSQIREKGGDYVLALKGNQGNLYGDVRLFFEDAMENGFGETGYDSSRTVEKDHGRIETREYYITSDIEWLFGKESWKGLRSIGMVKSQREIGR